MEDSLIGEEVDGYKIEDVLGRGGMGVVYKAEDVSLSRSVALKSVKQNLANDQEFLRRFRSEARALARVDSPYIVQIHALRRTDIGLIIVMEYVEGGSLKQCIDPGGMDWEEALPLIHQMLTAIEHAHGAGVTHRDIKPHNILLTDIVLAHGTRVKVTDFGLAKVNTSGDPSRTVTRNVYGSLNYMSPEQVKGNGQVDHRSDIYSMGMTIYEMLAGRLPFDEGSTEYTIMRTIVEKDLPPIDTFASDVPRRLQDIVNKSLRKDPADRFEDASAMKSAIETFNNSQPQESITLPGAEEQSQTSAQTQPVGEPQTTSESGTQWSIPELPSVSFSLSLSETSKGFLGMLGLFLVVALGSFFLFGPSLSVFFGEDESKVNLPQTEQAAPQPPPAISALASITTAGELETALQERVRNGTIAQVGGGPEEMQSPSECYVFVVGRDSRRVEAVLSPGPNRRDLKTNRQVSGWKSRYADHLKIWVAPGSQ